MVDLECLSPVGVGTYRMSIKDKEHFSALKTAVDNGYNLIDTATNYCGGTSEELIGSFIKKYPAYQNKLFIISKAGYLPSQNFWTAEFTRYLIENKVTIAKIDTDFEYSLDVNFIAYQLACSLKKLGRTYLDVYMLHNPERLFQSKNLNSSDALYEAISSAFQFLEKQVKEGKIRYYGVSSNCFFDPLKKHAIDLEQLLSIAASIQQNHHFKFIQFPFNFKEKEALQQNYNDHSLLSLAHSRGLITIGNRPLNMNDNGLEFRLVTHEKLLEGWNEESASVSLNSFLQQVDSKIKELTDGTSCIDDFEPMILLKKYYTSFRAKEAVDTFFNGQIFPFLHTVFDENFTSIEWLAQAIKEHACLYALQYQTNRTTQFLDKLQTESIPIQENSVLTACNAYLNEFDLDHILVGLRKPAYVAALKKRFTRN